MIYTGVFIQIEGNVLKESFSKLRARLIKKEWKVSDWTNMWEKGNGRIYKKVDGLRLIRLNNQKWILGYLENVKKNKRVERFSITKSELEWLNIVTNDLFEIQNTEVSLGAIDTTEKFKDKSKIVNVVSRINVSNIKHKRDYEWYERKGCDMESEKMQKLLKTEGLID